LKTLKNFGIIYKEDEGRAKDLKKNPSVSKYDTWGNALKAEASKPST
jgi:hypothetical protein